MRASTIEKGKFEILKPKALAYDVDPAGDYMRPGNNPAEQAFQLLRFGLEMVVHMTDNGFPTLDARTRKKAPKYIRQALFLFGDAGALIFAHTVPLLYVKVGGHLNGSEPPELTVDHHRRLYETVSSFYPFKRVGAKLWPEFLQEFDVLEQHKLPKEVIDGEQPANAYAQALMRGENPDEDPELLALQREYARDFFIHKATVAGIRHSLSPNDRKLLKNKFVGLKAYEEPGGAELHERIRNAWFEGCQPYLEYARLDA